MDDNTALLFSKFEANLEEQDEAMKRRQELASLKPGDKDYDEIYNEVKAKDVDDPHASTRGIIDGHDKAWAQRQDELLKEEGPIFEALCDAGFDMSSYCVDKHIRPNVRRAEQDPDARELRMTVDAILAHTNPQEVGSHSRNVSIFASLGASGFSGTREEDLADVDILDSSAPLLDNDQAADTVRVYDRGNDNLDIDVPVAVDNSGALWLDGFRIDKRLLSMLKQHQIEAVEMSLNVLLHGLNGVLLSHGMGCGKTITTMAILDTWMNRFKKARAVVCCPKSIIMQWNSELKDWSDIMPIDNFTNNTKLWLKYGGVVVVGHDQFKLTYADFQIDENTIVVVDEAHLLKQAKTEMYGVISSLPTKRKLFLTGSPVQNNLGEYYNLINLLAYGILGATQADFGRLYAEPINPNLGKDPTNYDIARSNATVKALRNRLFDTVVHSVDRDEIASTLPGKKEFCILHGCSGALMEDASVIKERHNVSAAARCDKISVITRLVASIRKHSDDNIVVFSVRNDLLKDLNHVEPGFLFTGELDMKVRDKVIQNFPSKTGDIIYMATKAGGVGINLATACRVILADASWNPTDDNQAIARCFRMKQQKPVVVYRLVADATMEKGIYRLCIKKHSVALRLASDSDVQNSFTHKDLYDLMKEDTKHVLNPSKCGDIVMKDVAASFEMGGTPLTILDHDKSFDEHAGHDDSCRSFAFDFNVYNNISYSCARFEEHPGGKKELLAVGKYSFEDETLCAPHVPAFLTNEGVNMLPSDHFKHNEHAFIRLDTSIQADPSIVNKSITIVLRVQKRQYTYIRCPCCNCKLLTPLDLVENEESILCSSCDEDFVYDGELTLSLVHDDDDVFEGKAADEANESWQHYEDIMVDKLELFHLLSRREAGTFKFRVGYVDASSGLGVFSGESALIKFEDDASAFAGAAVGGKRPLPDGNGDSSGLPSDDGGGQLPRKKCKIHKGSTSGHNE